MICKLPLEYSVSYLSMCLSSCLLHMCCRCTIIFWLCCYNCQILFNYKILSLVSPQSVTKIMVMFLAQVHLQVNLFWLILCDICTVIQWKP